MDKTPADIPAGLPDIAQLVSAARATGQVQVVRQVFDGLTVDVRVGTESPRRPRRKTGILATDDPLFQLDRHMPEMSASEAANPPVSSDKYRYIAETYNPPSERQPFTGSLDSTGAEWVSFHVLEPDAFPFRHAAGAGRDAAGNHS